MTVDPDNLKASLPGRPRDVWAWACYDWASSAYSTLSITILVYYIQAVVLPGDWGPVVWAWGISLSMFVAAVLSPVVGAMADANCNKRRWLAATALGGAAASLAIAAVPPTSSWLVVGFFVLTALMFELSLGFYNGFLPEIADEHAMNRVSAWGYALGYIGGALALVLAMLVKQYGPQLGLPELGDQLRVGIVIMGLWWGGFSLPTLLVLKDRGRPPEHPLPLRPATRKAIGEVGRTLRNIRSYKILSIFLLGYLFYNDGIQTVISQSSTFAIRELSFDPSELIGLILMIQFVAMPGAMAVGWLADRLGQKPTLLGCLAIWIGLVVTAFFIESKLPFWVLGVVLALVMGGTQSVSRAIMGRMTPAHRTAEFFGFFNFSGKATSFLGTFLFGLVIQITGSARLSVLSLLVFFLIGLALAWRIDVAEGRRQAVAET